MSPIVAVSVGNLCRIGSGITPGSIKPQTMPLLPCGQCALRAPGKSGVASLGL
ncbi:hypothetical protein [Methylomonas koyamae]|uniref:hypothetical protein n=1 Tax=Methylomonas koyamae TaxID=702114 RepID=UPI000A4B1D6B|nr:hypothetical protein [Methylomonas koyamae]